MDKLLPIIVKNKIVSQMPNIAQTVAFYPFIAFKILVWHSLQKKVLIG
jgi:aminopeptidase N